MNHQSNQLYIARQDILMIQRPQLRRSKDVSVRHALNKLHYFVFVH
jgi:hypothetical protein